MNGKVLIAYATLSGSTAEVAEAIGETLGQEGASVSSGVSWTTER